MTQSEANAWMACKTKFDFDEVELPLQIESNDHYILLSWSEEDARKEGGPIMCRTNAAGTEVIELHSSGAPF